MRLQCCDTHELWISFVFVGHNVAISSMLIASDPRISNIDKPWWLNFKKYNGGQKNKLLFFQFVFVASNFFNAQLFCYYTFFITVMDRKIIALWPYGHCGSLRICLSWKQQVNIYSSDKHPLPVFFLERKTNLDRESRGCPICNDSLYMLWLKS